MAAAHLRGLTPRPGADDREADVAGRIRRHWKGLTAAAVALVVLLVVGVPYVYIHFIEGEAPPPLSLSDASGASTAAGSDSSTPGRTTAADSAGAGDAGPSVTEPTSGSGTASPAESTAAGATSSAADGIAGTWTIGSGSQAGYRVHETLAGQSTTAVGRTGDVTGSLTISDSAITAAQVTVQVTTIASDNGQRDRQFTGRIMNASQYPTATFTLTQPISYDAALASGADATLSATGELTLHGTTKDVTVPITVQRTDSGLAATGTIDIAYQDYGINNPSVGGFVSVGDSGTIEFLIVATRD
jgi:polyisoprenoid-binding protein YceI